MLPTIIVVSCLRDLAINALSVPALIENVAAREYLIVVPGPDVHRFRPAIPAGVTLVAEEEVLRDWPLRRIAGRLPAGTASRAGWYLQQFLKIEAVRQLPSGGEALLWDGDTVPIRSLSFKDSSNRIGFYVGRENHAPYFATMHRLLGVERAIRQSFIAQCMYLKCAWAGELVDSIEHARGRPWVDAVLAEIRGESASEFSEYETMGTFAMVRHPQDCYLIGRPWFRWGMARFGSLNNVTRRGLARLSSRYDFVAFERWDRGGIAWARSRYQLMVDRLRYRDLAGGKMPQSRGD